MADIKLNINIVGDYTSGRALSTSIAEVHVRPQNYLLEVIIMSKTDGIGTWVWNDTIPGLVYPGLYVCSFSSSNISFSQFEIFMEGPMQNGLAYHNSTDGSINAYSPISGWLGGGNSPYRTIDIKTAPPAEFLTILQANATYQEPTATTSQYLDETGLKQFAAKAKEYVDNRTANRITNLVAGTDVVEVTIVSGGGGYSNP